MAAADASPKLPVDIPDPAVFGDLRKLCETGQVERVAEAVGLDASKPGPLRSQVNEKDKIGSSCTAWAMRNGYSELVDILKGCDADFESVAYGNLGPLHMAVTKNQVECVQFLAKEVEISAKDV